jgi:hypothetical protein
MHTALQRLFPVLLILAASLAAWNASAQEPEVEPGTPAEPEPATDNLPAEERLIAFGDVHGGATELTKLLTALDLIDEDGGWVGGAVHLLSLGDLLDRGPDSRAVMDLLMRLEAEAPASGGQVSLILGNHEIMNLTGDLRYVSAAEYAAFAPDESPEERQAEFDRFLAAYPEPAPEAEVLDADVVEAVFTERFPPGFFAHRRAFSPDGRYGAWLLSKPQILVVDDVAFVHGGLSEHFAGESIEDFNLRAAAELEELLALGGRLAAEGTLPRWSDYVSVPPPEGVLLPEELLTLRNRLAFTEEGPSWYRGTASCHAVIEGSRFERVLEARGLKTVVMGHTPTNPRIVQTRFDGRAVLADTGMYRDYYGGLPTAVVFEGGEMTALTLQADGTLTPQLGVTPADRRAAGEVLLTEELAEKSSSLSFRPGEPAELVLGGREYRILPHRGGSRAIRRRLAARAIDLHLGLGLTAPVITHGSGNRAMTLEAVPASAFNEVDRAGRGLVRPNYCGSPNEYELLYAFDALIGNNGRNGQTMHYDPATWLIYLTGHDQAFTSGDELPSYLTGMTVTLPEALRDALAALSADSLDELVGEYLGKREIDMLLKRRHRMLEWPVAGSNVDEPDTGVAAEPGGDPTSGDSQ